MNIASACREIYQGDAALSGLLAKAAGLRLAEPTAAAARDLIAGSLAAPDDVDSGAWLSLIAENPTPALQAQLCALRAEMAKGQGDGVEDDPLPTTQRLAAVRRELAELGVDGFIVPRADEHQGEYVPLFARRLAWLTGFTGSAGIAAVLPERAAIFVDGRYTLQAQTEVDAAAFASHHITQHPLTEWLSAHLKPGQTLGFDPWLHTVEDVARMRAICEKAGAMLKALSANPVDRAWTRQPPMPIAPVVPFDLAFAGRSSAEKRGEIAAALTKAVTKAVVITLPDSLAWLLNIRGGDVAYAPLPLGFAILYDDGRLDLFMDPRKAAPSLAAHLGNEVRLAPRAEFAGALAALKGKRVQADPASAPAWVFDRLEAAGAKIVKAADPCQAPKAKKSATELAGIRVAHLRDGAALTTFLAWFAQTAAKGGLSEIAAADKLEEIRARGENFRGLSFPTIAGAGGNGAIVHYRATPASDKGIAQGQMFLLDSGAQYLDGTTDVTRTLFVGGANPPSDEQRAAFTRVLKGHIALAMARFPVGTSGSQLDALARMPLWQAGMDYDHGTGHGVGHYLSVHEGPQRISKLPNRVALEPGMVISNEPGYYKAGAFGIRIENLVAVRDAGAGPDGVPMLDFETLTLAPIERALIEPALLTADEKVWINAYHARVNAALSPLVDSVTQAWLAGAAAPIR
ncbi:MAG TPA: aminopeptidase P family protein [Alphaproteobacteria bacterium]|nr:aminopeptidase P family protein [Alphaproteobacteria bacterium]